MKYIVSGYIGFSNFGDEAVAEVLIQKLKREGAERIVLISSSPDSTKQLHNVETCSMFNFWKELSKSDVLISGGGSLLQDVTSLKSLMYYLSVICSALILGKKLVIYAQGIGPINSFLGKILTKFFLKRADKVSVRDMESQLLLQNWGIPSELVKDPVFELELPQIQKQNILGIQLRKFSGVTPEFLKLLSKEVSKRFSKYEIHVISLQDSIDVPTCESFAKLLTEDGCSSVKILKSLNLNEIVEELCSLKYLIAMRFHANIIGIKSGAKIISINYDPKVEKLAKEYSLSVINLDDKDMSEQFKTFTE